MLPSLQILARGDDSDGMIKLVVGAIVVFFWLIGGLVSAVNKKAKEAQLRQMSGRMPQAAPAAPRVKAKAKPAPRQQPKRAVFAAPAVPTAAPMPSASRIAPAAQAPQQPAARPVPPAQIGRLLLRPETLRAAFILNEVLSPPLSVRGAPGGKEKT